MSISIKSFLLTSTLAFSLSISGCSKSTENSELEEIKQELAELKKEMAKTSDDDVKPAVELPTADDLAFEKARADGRVQAFGIYAKNFSEGKYLKAADEGAWKSAERQNSAAAFDAYLKYFPEGQFIRESYLNIHIVQNQLSEKTLDDLGYNVAEFPAFGAISIDNNGTIDLTPSEVIPSKSAAALEGLKDNTQRDNTQTQQEQKLQEAIKTQEVIKIKEAEQESLKQQALRQDAIRKDAIRKDAERQEMLKQEGIRQEIARQEAIRQQNLREIAAKKEAKERDQLHLASYVRKTDSGICKDINKIFKKQKSQKFNGVDMQAVSIDKGTCVNFHYKDQDAGYLKCVWPHDYRAQAQKEFNTLVSELGNCFSTTFDIQQHGADGQKTRNNLNDNQNILLSYYKNTDKNYLTSVQSDYAVEFALYVK